MAQRTGIQWAHHTWSPWRGCQKVSDGCVNCYAETLAKRNPAVLGEWGPNGRRVVNKDWDAPRRWDRAAAKAGERRRVFPSLCDWLEDRPELRRPRSEFLKLIEDTPHLDWLLLTKRPKNLAKLIVEASEYPGPGLPMASRWLEVRSPENVWLGVSVEDQATADARIPALLSNFTPLRWVSYEPALGPVDFTPWFRKPLAEPWSLDPSIIEYDRTVYFGIDWIVVGGESGRDARLFDVAWARKTIADCRAAGVPSFVKQLGRQPFDSAIRISIDGPDSHMTVLVLDDPKGGDPSEWPLDLRVREMPDSPAGRTA